MKKVFWDNPYQTELTAKVESVNGNEFFLMKRLFFHFVVGKKAIKLR